MKTKTRVRGPMHMWTKQDLKQIITLWEKESVQALADRIGVKKNSVQQIASRFRKMGVKLAHKRQNGRLDLLMKEVAKEYR